MDASFEIFSFQNSLYIACFFISGGPGDGVGEYHKIQDDETEQNVRKSEYEKLLFPMGGPPGIKHKADVKGVSQEKYAGSTITSG